MGTLITPWHGDRDKRWNSSRRILNWSKLCETYYIMSKDISNTLQNFTFMRTMVFETAGSRSTAPPPPPLVKGVGIKRLGNGRVKAHGIFMNFSGGEGGGGGGGRKRLENIGIDDCHHTSLSTKWQSVFVRLMDGKGFPLLAEIFSGHKLFCYDQLDFIFYFSCTKGSVLDRLLSI